MDKLGLQGIYHWKAGMTTIIEQIKANMGLIDRMKLANGEYEVRVLKV